MSNLLCRCHRHQANLGETIDCFYVVAKVRYPMVNCVCSIMARAKRKHSPLGTAIAKGVPRSATESQNIATRAPDCYQRQPDGTFKAVHVQWNSATYQHNHNLDVNAAFLFVFGHLLIRGNTPVATVQLSEAIQLEGVVDVQIRLWLSECKITRCHAEEPSSIVFANAAQVGQMANSLARMLSEDGFMETTCPLDVLAHLDYCDTGYNLITVLPSIWPTVHIEPSIWTKVEIWIEHDLPAVEDMTRMYVKSVTFHYQSLRTFDEWQSLLNKLQTAPRAQKVRIMCNDPSTGLCGLPEVWNVLHTKFNDAELELSASILEHNSAQLASLNVYKLRATVAFPAFSLCISALRNLKKLSIEPRITGEELDLCDLNVPTLQRLQIGNFLRLKAPCCSLDNLINLDIVVQSMSSWTGFLKLCKACPKLNNVRLDVRLDCSDNVLNGVLWWLHDKLRVGRRHDLYASGITVSFNRNYIYRDTMDVLDQFWANRNALSRQYTQMHRSNCMFKVRPGIGEVFSLNEIRQHLGELRYFDHLRDFRRS